MNRPDSARRSRMAAPLVCLLLLGKPIAANADELTRMTNSSFALTMLDMATTRLSIAHTNGRESNPIARPFVRSDAGALGYAVMITALERVAFRKHPQRFVAVDGIETYAVVHNYISRLHALDVTRAEELTEHQR